MHEGNVIKHGLMDEFFALGGNSDRAKILLLKKKVQKYFKNAAPDLQLMDLSRLIEVFLEELDLNDFDVVYRTAWPVVDRLMHTEKWDYYDIRIAVVVVDYTMSYKATHRFAQKILNAWEEYYDHEQYSKVKLSVCVNTIFRFLRAKFYELDYVKPSSELNELRWLFSEYTKLGLSLCESPENWVARTIINIRKGIFERDHEAVDEGLILMRERGGTVMYRLMADEVSGYNVFSDNNITKLQVNLKVGRTIRRLRKAKGMTLEEFAPKVGMSVSALALAEQGKRAMTAYDLAIMTHVLEISVDELMGGKGRVIIREEANTEIRRLNNICRLLSKDALTTLCAVARHMDRGRSIGASLR